MNTAIKGLLLSSNYWIVNKTLLNTFGLEACFLLSAFAEAENMLSDEDGWFYQTSKTIEKQTTLKRFKQDEAIKRLKEYKVLEQKNKGMPMKRYFKLNYDVLYNLLLKTTSSSLLNNNNQVCCRATNKDVRNQQPNLSETSNNKESINKESINKENIKDSGNIVAEPIKENKVNKFEVESEEYKLAEYLYKAILKNDKKYKKPNLDNWAVYIDRLIRLDNRSVEEIKKVIDFATNDDFWKANILSTKKLRKHFSKLLIQMKNKPKRNYYKQGPRLDDTSEEIIMESVTDEAYDNFLNDIWEE